jgi:hypothetical protein
MENLVILHKSIIDDWKFKDEGILKFWILLLFEELEDQKDKEGLFEIKNLTQTAKQAGINRQKAMRVLKRMEQDKTITLLPIHYKQNDQKFSSVKDITKTRISINKEVVRGHCFGHINGHSSTDVKTSNEGDNYTFNDNALVTPSVGISDDSMESWGRNLQAEIMNKSGHCFGHINGHSSVDFKSFGEEDNYDSEKENVVTPSVGISDSFLGGRNLDMTPPPTPEEERSWRRIALRSAIKLEIGYLFRDETVNRFINELLREYDGSPDKETQLVVRANFLRKVYGSFEDTLEIKKAELYSKHKHNPYVLDPNTKRLCEELLDPEFLELSRREAFQYDEQKMIKVTVRGPRKIGDIAKELVSHLSGHTGGHSLIDTKRNTEPIKQDSQPTELVAPVVTSAVTFANEPILTESNPSNHVGAELALKSINEVNTILNTNIKNISTSTVQENKLSTVQENIFFKGGYRGEKNQEGFVGETPTEKLPVEKKSTVAEIHTDGRPVFSSKAFKSLPRAKQIQIIGERLNDFAELFPTVDVEFQFDHWKDWMDAKGQTFKDYSAAFRNWLRKSLDLAAKSNSGTPAKIYTETGAKFVTQEVFTNPAHVPFKKEAPRNPNLKRRPGIGGSE